MKNVYATLTLLVIAANSFSQVTWQTPITVATSSYGNLHPRVALNRSGNPMVLWGKTNMNANFSRWTGTAFSTPVSLNPMATLPIFALSWAGPDLASFGDTVYVVMKKNPETVDTHYNFIVHSYDGGVTFSAPTRIDNIDTNKSRFPLVTTDATGNPVVGFMKFNSMFMGARYVVTKSADYGMTFSADVRASNTTDEVCDCCPAALISSGSKMIMLYRNNASDIRDSWAGISTDGGMTFPNNINVDNNNWSISMCPSSGPDGFVIGDSLYSVFRSSAGGTAKVYLSRASISGLSSSTATLTGTITGLLSQDYPRIANVGSTAVAVWKQNTSTGNSIVYAFTNNISAGFSGYATVTSATGSGVQNADVIMAPGVVHIVWEDDISGTVKYIKGTYATASVASLPTKELIEVYPNPAQETFAVNTNAANMSYSYLSDNIGRQYDLQYSDKNGKLTFSLAGIAKGMYYFVMGDDAGKTYYSKIIVE